MNQGDNIIKFGELVKAGHPPALCVQLRNNHFYPWVAESHPYWHESWEYRVALAFVEGKPVFEGDVLYLHGTQLIIDKHIDGAVEGWSWSPPKPKTAMVELSVKDIEYWKEIGDMQTKPMDKHNNYLNASYRFYEACRKKLENLK